LAAYRRFLDDSGLDWLVFPSQKLNRPTYRFNGHLVSSAVAGEIAPSTAKRRMSTVVSYYRWLQTEDLFHPENDPWKEGDRFVAISSNQGGTILKKVAKSDLSIRFNESEDPYNGTISDGGKLRPLSYEEQGWVLDALDLQGNPEMMLIHLFALLTGARIQTILTCKVRHVLKPRGQSAGELISLPVGPGSGIDTKLDKGMVLYMPAWFYNRLRVYAQSDRAKRRRERAQGGDSLDQYIFLSVRAAPFYSTKADQANYDPSNRLRYSRMGQGVRQFIFERVIARIRSETSPKFHYRFHDLRATFGMNLTDKLLQQVQSGKISLHQARENLRMRMGHKSSATTDLYLDHRAKRAWIREANDDYDLHLQQLAERSMEGI
jgi:integrase